jgi:hypothetical protein
LDWRRKAGKVELLHGDVRLSRQAALTFRIPLFTTTKECMK